MCHKTGVERNCPLLTRIAYTNTWQPTPNVSFAYDPVYERLATMTDGSGSTSYTYHPVDGSTFGAGNCYGVACSVPSQVGRPFVLFRLLGCIVVGGIVWVRGVMSFLPSSLRTERPVSIASHQNPAKPHLIATGKIEC